MQQSIGQRSVTAPVVLGLILIAVGGAALIFRETGVNLLATIAAWGWPFFVIVPGVILLLASLVPAPPKGIGFAIAGSIVTTVGSLLLYQSNTGHWESWAYAWALIPMGAGVGMVLYGLLTRARNLVTSGLWMAGIAAVLFAVGAWYFELLFAGDVRFADLGSWWPVGLIAIGVLIALRALIFPTQPETPSRDVQSSEPSPL